MSKISEKDLRDANNAGILHHETDPDFEIWWGYYSPMLQSAYDLGRSEGLSLGNLVTGKRYGSIPENGISINHASGEAEKGCSVVSVDGSDEIGGWWCRGRKVVHVEGVLSPETGSDGEPLVFPVNCIENLD